MCVFVTVTALRIIDDGNIDAVLTYLLTYDRWLLLGCWDAHETA